ncbi:MAG TPA: DUF4349 domain-containing protein [Gemmatimonadaceae bacterium]|jgi:hypothetical protein|nr:DUF4349 domain-containing protein [Gemmatimonadaceae bacterium]
MRIDTVGSIVVALLMIAGCESSTERGSDASYVAGNAPPPAAAGAPTADAARREAKASASDAAGLSGRGYAPEVQGSTATVTFPTSQSAADSLPAAMIVRTGDASIEVDSLESGIAAIRALATRLGGYVANTAMQAGNAQVHSAMLQLRIPSARFDEALAALRPIGKLESTNINAEDVGEEYVDVSAQVANGRRLEARLVQILATRTGKLADVLAVERELARVRGEIDRQEGRLRYLRAHAAMSTLAVTVHEPLPIVGQQGSGGVIAESFRQSWRNFVSFVASFIAALGTLVPLLVVLGLVGYGVVRVARRTKRQIPQGAGEPAA